MHSVHRCNCSVRALELFVRDFAGVEIRTRSTRPFLFRQSRNISSARKFGTTSASNIQRSTSCFTSLASQSITKTQALEDAHEPVAAPTEQVSVENASLSGPYFSETPKSRTEGRKERKVRREEQTKLQAEEAKEAAAAEKKKARRERQRQAAEGQSSLSKSSLAETEAAEGVAGKEASATPGKNQRKRERRKLAAEAAAPPSSPPAPASAPALAEQLTVNDTDTPSRKDAEEAKDRKATKSKKSSESKKAEGTEKIAAMPVQEENETQEMKRERETWMTQKAALQAKFGEQPWNPRKRISPDALAGIRTLHAQQPNVYSTEVLSSHFKVSPEAIRRILKSKWQPDEEASEDRRKRWEKRGAKKWKEMVELGIRPPKKWRDMGVGKVGKGETPTWKKGGARGGERWIEHAETDSFVIAGDMESESAETKISDRIM